MLCLPLIWLRLMLLKQSLIKTFPFSQPSMTHAATEYIIAVVQGDESDQRIVFASRSDVDRPIVLRHESFSQDVGWFTQSEVEMTRQEMVLLRSVMGGQQPKPCLRTTRKIQSQEEVRPDTEPRILLFSSISAAS